MSIINIVMFSSLAIGIALLVLYFKVDKFSNDFILISSIVFILFGLYFLVQKLTGFMKKSNDGFSA